MRSTVGSDYLPSKPWQRPKFARVHTDALLTTTNEESDSYCQRLLTMWATRICICKWESLFPLIPNPPQNSAMQMNSCIGDIGLVIHSTLLILERLVMPPSTRIVAFLPGIGFRWNRGMYLTDLFSGSRSLLKMVIDSSKSS